MPYTIGVLQGFQEAREKEELKNYNREVQNRQFADRVFGHLLQSNDPDMRALALSGLAEPITGAKKGGFGGYLGQYRETNPIYAQILARSNEMIPDPGVGGGPSPPAPGSAGMSTNAPVEPGSAPIQQMPGTPMPPEPPPFKGAGGAGGGDPFAGGTAPSPQQLGPTNEVGPTGLGMPPPQAPMESRFKRRGTGVPTAEEIAEMNARVPLEQRVGLIRQNVLDPSQQQRAIQNVLSPGSPESNKQLVQVNFGVRNPATGQVIPVLLDQTGGGLVLADGHTPMPNTWERVQQGGAGAGMSLSTKIQDTPENRARLIAELQAQGADPQEIAMIQAGSSTRWWRRKEQGGVVMVAEDTPYTPPQTAFVPGLDQSGNQGLIAVPRVVAPGTVVATSPQQTIPDDQAAAAALLDTVRARVRGLEVPPYLGGTVHKATLDEINTAVKEEATKAGLPYLTMYDLVAATKKAPARQVTPRANAPDGTTPTTPKSDAQGVLEYMQQQRRQRAGAPPPPQPARSQGPGPGAAAGR